MNLSSLNKYMPPQLSSLERFQPYEHILKWAKDNGMERFTMWLESITVDREAYEYNDSIPRMDTCKRVSDLSLPFDKCCQGIRGTKKRTVVGRTLCKTILLGSVDTCMNDELPRGGHKRERV